MAIALRSAGQRIIHDGPRSRIASRQLVDNTAKE